MLVAKPQETRLKLSYWLFSDPIAVLPNDGRPRTPALKSESTLSIESSMTSSTWIFPDILESDNATKLYTIFQR